MIKTDKKCSVCEYPLSEIHHMAEQSEFGKNNFTIRLCPNCHYLFHVIKNNNKVEELGKIVVAFGGLDEKLIKIKKLVSDSIDIENKLRGE